MRIGMLISQRAFELGRLPGGTTNHDVRLGQLARALNRHERTSEAVRASLERAGHEMVSFSVDDSLFPRLREARIDIVFNTYFRPASRQDQACVASLMEYAGVAFTGGGASCHCVGLSKPLSKRVIAACGLPTPGLFVVDDPSDTADAFLASGLGFSLIVKVPSEGEGIGLDGHSVVHSSEELQGTVRSVIMTFGPPASSPWGSSRHVRRECFPCLRSYSAMNRSTPTR